MQVTFFAPEKKSRWCCAMYKNTLNKKQMQKTQEGQLRYISVQNVRVNAAQVLVDVVADGASAENEAGGALIRVERAILILDTRTWTHKNRQNHAQEESSHITFIQEHIDKA